MQLGSMWMPPSGPRHAATRLLSQPQPGPGVTPVATTGLSPVKPSVDAMTAYKCPPQDGESAMLNVMSEMANWPAMLMRFGIEAGWYPLMHWYLGAAHWPD